MSDIDSVCSQFHQFLIVKRWLRLLDHCQRYAAEPMADEAFCVPEPSSLPVRWPMRPPVRPLTRFLVRLLIRLLTDPQSPQNSKTSKVGFKLY